MVEAEGLTSINHGAELGDSHGLVQVLMLYNDLQLVQHSQNATPLRYIGFASMDSVEMRSSDNSSNQRTIVPDPLVILSGELERKKYVGNDGFQRRKIPRVENGVRHCDEGY